MSVTLPSFQVPSFVRNLQNMNARYIRMATLRLQCNPDGSIKAAMFWLARDSSGPQTLARSLLENLVRYKYAFNQSMAPSFA